jgi:predicted branched-subunit amino acid permease
MALSAATAFRGGWLRRLLEAQLLVDESWALSQRDGHFDRRILIGAGAALYVGWSGGTAIGVVAGDSLADPATLGLDAAFPALFLALLVPLVRDRRALAAALLGAGIALALTPLTPAGIPVIAATSACLVGLSRR